MKANDGRMRRGAIGSSESYVVVRNGCDRADRKPGRISASPSCAGFVRVPLAFALLAFLFIPAQADFRVCNKTHTLINIAVGTDAGEAFKTEGWWVATPGSCATPVR